MPKHDPPRLDGSRTGHRADRPQQIHLTKANFQGGIVSCQQHEAPDFFHTPIREIIKKSYAALCAGCLCVFGSDDGDASRMFRVARSLEQHSFNHTPHRELNGTARATGRVSHRKPQSRQPVQKRFFLCTPDLRERADVSPKHGFPRFPFFLPPGPIIQLALPLDEGIELAHSVIDDDGT